MHASADPLGEPGGRASGSRVQGPGSRAGIRSQRHNLTLLMTFVAKTRYTWRPYELSSVGPWECMEETTEAAAEEEATRSSSGDWA